MEPTVLTDGGDAVRIIEREKKIGLLGGTFNPPHNGHLFMAERAYNEFALDKVLVMPLRDPPHKDIREVLPAPVRALMVEKMLDGKPHLEFSRIELERTGTTYTIDTLELLKKYEPEWRIYYIIGSDTLFELENWKRCTDVFALCEFICFMRGGCDRNAVFAKAAYMKEVYGKEILLSAAEAPDISSTDIRRRASLGMSIEGLVPETVRLILEDYDAYKEG